MATAKKEKKKSLQEVYQEKSERVLEGVAYWASFYRKNPQRFVLEYLNVKLKLFQKILIYMMMVSTNFMYIASRGSGKTWLTSLYCVVRCILYPGTKICVACINDDNMADRCKIRNANKVIWSIKATADFNTKAAIALRAGFQNGSINLLTSEFEAEELVKKVRGYTKMTKFTDTVYDDATTSAHGLMTAAMVTKLNGIASGANKTTVDSELSSTSTNPVQNKVINTALAGKANSSHGNHVPATQTANNATFLRNDNTWAKVTPANIGAQPAGSYAATSHTHDDRYYTEAEMDTKLNGKANSSHTHGNGDITSLDAGKITSGTISIDRLPQGALERLTVVADDTARFKLTSSTIQKGDTVKVTSSGKMYYVVDETKLSSEAGYEVYAAGTAASVPWSGVTGKPSSYIPSSHTHTKTEVGLGNVDNTADSTKSVKYATSAGSAGWATKATAIVDYAQTSKNIQIGYNGNGIKGDEIKFIAGYTAGNGSDVTAKIKDVSKDALKSWLGLGSLAYSSASIPSVGNGTITITQNGTSKGTFTMNQSGNTTIALTDTNTDTNTVTNIGTAANNYTNGNILFQGSGATTVSKSGNTITISSTDTTYTLAGLMGSTAKGSSDYGVYWNGSSFVQTKHIPTVDNSATFTSGNPAASAAIMTNVLEHTMWLEKHVAISSYGTTTLCNLADQAASHTSGAYLVLISGMTSSCKSEIYLIYNMQNNNKTFYMQQVASAGGSSTACTLTISGTTLTATVQGNSAPYRNIFVFRCTI